MKSYFVLVIVIVNVIVILIRTILKIQENIIFAMLWKCETSNKVIIYYIYAQ